MEPPALTNLVIISAYVWLRLKVMNTKGEGKANIINFRKHFCQFSELISPSYSIISPSFSQAKLLKWPANYALGRK